MRPRKRCKEMRGAVSGEALVPLVAEERSCGWQVGVTEQGVAAAAAPAGPGALSPVLSRSNPTNPSHCLLLLHHFILKYTKKTPFKCHMFCFQHHIPLFSSLLPSSALDY